MSDFSVFEHEFINFFANSSDPSMQAAGQAMSTAKDAITQALPAVGANLAATALSKVGPVGQSASPLVGLLIEATIASLLAQHPNPAAAKAAVAAS